MRMTTYLAALTTLVASGLIIGAAQAAVIVESEPNDTLATALNIDAFFTLDFSPNIGDVLGNNTSTTIPHVTINAAGDGTFDYFSFTIPSGGARAILDIDFGQNIGMAGDIDTEIAVWTSDGVLINENDDSLTFNGAGGSQDLGSPNAGVTLDAFLELIFPAGGQYIVGVAEFAAFGGPGGWHRMSSPPDAGDTYTLQVSIANHHQAPEPGSLALVSLALGGLGLIARRRRLR